MTASVITAIDLPVLFALVPVQGPTADFLTPPPRSPLPAFSEEVTTLRGTRPERVVADLAGVPGLPAAIGRRFRRDPDGELSQLADVVEAYWGAALAEHRPRMQAVLAADVRWRAHRITSGGAAALFEDLHETIRWNTDRVSAQDPWDYTGSLSGEGLLLVPSVMTWPHVRKMIEPYPAQLVHPAPDSRAALIGATRPAILTSLAEPASTTGLARRHSVTPAPSASNLSVLRSAGLVTGERTRSLGTPPPHPIRGPPRRVGPVSEAGGDSGTVTALSHEPSGPDKSR